MTSSRPLVLLLLLLPGLLPGSALAAPAPSNGISVAASAPQSPAELRAATKSLLAEIQRDLDVLSAQVGKAEKEGNVDRIQCIRQAEKNIRTMLGAAQRAAGALEMALADQSKDKASANFRSIQVARGKVRGFVKDAATCQGTVSASGRTDLQLTGGDIEELPDDPWDCNGDCEPPPELPTPFR